MPTIIKKPVLFVTTAALIDSENRVLLAQRPPGKTMAGLWEFPGGKVHEGETPEAALVRELEEELGIKVAADNLQPLSFASHAYDEFHLFMPLFVCRNWKGEPQAQEGQILAWAHKDELANYEMPPADVGLVEALKEIL